VHRHQLAELHYITAIDNVRSILEVGLLSHAGAARLSPRTIADEAVQARRARKVVPHSGRRLHSYANLYLNARNPMLYRLSSIHRDLCVLRVSQDVLDLEGVVIADRNAASDYAAFWPAPGGLARIVYEDTFGEWWYHPELDQIEQWRLKSAMQAEILVPDLVAPNFILGAYVATNHVLANCHELGYRIDFAVNSFLFFRAGR
jgi:hypothetical protein